MPLTLNVPDDIAAAVEHMAKDTGSTAEELILGALKAHFPPIPDDLKTELDAWDRASDEDFARFVQKEGV